MDTLRVSHFIREAEKIVYKDSWLSIKDEITENIGVWETVVQYNACSFITWRGLGEPPPLAVIYEDLYIVESHNVFDFASKYP